MLNSWFPLEGSPPRAYLVDTSEDAELTSDWLKGKIIQSNQPRLVDYALGNLDTVQVVMFVQMFGLPVEGASKLLGEGEIWIICL